MIGHCPLSISRGYLAWMTNVGHAGFRKETAMKKKELSNASPDSLTLGKLLGRREALAAVAGRCTAAEAIQIRQIREEKAYLASARSWGEFCKEHLHMSKSNADRLIALLDEFGPDYFTLAQLTRISPETYRAIAPTIREGALHADGEAIALIPENASKVATAVSGLRKHRDTRTHSPSGERFAGIERRCEELLAEFRTLAGVAGCERCHSAWGDVNEDQGCSGNPGLGNCE